jgi:hypothetical protein
MKVRDKRSDLTNGLGPDSWYAHRVGTDLPVLMFDTDIRGSIRDIDYLKEIREQFNSNGKKEA